MADNPYDPPGEPPLDLRSSRDLHRLERALSAAAGGDSDPAGSLFGVQLAGVVIDQLQAMGQQWAEQSWAGLLQALRSDGDPRIHAPGRCMPWIGLWGTEASLRLAGVAADGGGSPAKPETTHWSVALCDDQHGGEYPTPLTAWYSGPSGIDRLVMEWDRASSGATIRFVPSTTASWGRVTLHMLCRRPLLRPPRIALLDGGGDPLELPTVAGPLGQGLHRDAPLRLVWWTEGLDPESGGQCYSTLDQQSQRVDGLVLNSLECRFEVSRLVGRDPVIVVDLEQPGPTALFSAAVFCPDLGSLCSGKDPDSLLRPTRWQATPRQRNDNGIPNIDRVALDLRPDEESGDLHRASDLRSALRRLGGHRALATRQDLADAVNRLLATSPPLAAVGAYLDPRLVGGDIEFDRSNRRVATVWSGTVVTGTRQDSTLRRVAEDHFRLVQRALAPRLPPGTELRLHLRLDSDMPPPPDPQNGNDR